MRTALKILNKIGLSEKEPKIYICLLEYGDQTAGTIARKTDINRATCYQVLDKLKAKGLLSSYKKRETLFFSSENIEGILSFLENKKDKINQNIKLFEQSSHLFKEIVNTSAEDTKFNL